MLGATGNGLTLFNFDEFPPVNQGNYVGHGLNQRGLVLQHSTLVDENYMVISMHLDSALRDKIKKGEYVNFSRLLPKDRLAVNDEPKLQIVNREGQTFFVPSDHESSGITNFSKWEQTFRIYSNIFSREHPDRAAELIQYNHVIFTAASTYLWDNV